MENIFGGLQKDVSKYSVMIAEEDADIDTDLPGEVLMYYWLGWRVGRWVGGCGEVLTYYWLGWRVGRWVW